ncbi:hypothetical protein C8J57DRAFT_1336424 [Mycena rebaudengoi]|nr:hypothetical protein C8J57DRAFT_1336424 [Mycena rebaudengoi]
MTPASALVALLLLTGAASLHVPGCLPDEDATIVSEAMFEVPDIVAMPFRFKISTITHFTCPSRQALAQQKPSERQDLQGGVRIGGTHHNLERQTPTPIQLCGIIGGSELFKSKFNCEQSSANEPTLNDCGIFATEVIDSEFLISLFNNTCVFVFLNNDVSNTYATCVESITDIFDNMANECHSRRDGFIGSVQSRRSPGNPSALNWAVK